MNRRAATKTNKAMTGATALAFACLLLAACSDDTPPPPPKPVPATVAGEKVEGLVTVSGDDSVAARLTWQRPVVTLDPDDLPVSDPSAMNFGSGSTGDAKAWKDIWGAGQGIGAVQDVVPVADLVAQMTAQYEQARARLSL